MATYERLVTQCITFKVGRPSYNDQLVRLLLRHVHLYLLSHLQQPTTNTAVNAELTKHSI
jgi:hypothetical protein